MRRWTIALALVAVATGAQAAGYTPDAATIAKLEASITPGRVPGRGTIQPVASYARYYAGTVIGGEPMIVGEFVMPVGARPAAGIYMVANEQQMPSIFDGGCTVVHVLYDARQSRLVFARCQGVA
jgi:hypothetical protein